MGNGFKEIKEGAIFCSPEIKSFPWRILIQRLNKKWVKTCDLCKEQNIQDQFIHNITCQNFKKLVKICLHHVHPNFAFKNYSPISLLFGEKITIENEDGKKVETYQHNENTKLVLIVFHCLWKFRYKFMKEEISKTNVKKSNLPKELMSTVFEEIEKELKFLEKKICPP